MRIIAGTRKGLRLRAPEGRGVRPTSDRAREALMSVLGGYFDGEIALDLCAGTGAVGLELLSRGCGRAVFVEKASEALACLRDNVQRTRLADLADIRAQRALPALRALSEAGERFDLVFVDPPYGDPVLVPALELLVTGGLLRGGARVWVETEGGLPDVPEGLTRLQTRRYGRATFDELCLSAEAP